MEQKQYWLGLPKHLFWGFIAIAIFMSGDGFEMAFLSKHITDLGFYTGAIRDGIYCLWFNGSRCGVGICCG